MTDADDAADDSAADAPTVRPAGAHEGAVLEAALPAVFNRSADRPALTLDEVTVRPEAAHYLSDRPRPDDPDIAAGRGIARLSPSVERPDRARPLHPSEGFTVVGADVDADMMQLDLCGRATDDGSAAC